MWYVYAHYLENEDIPFYIGVGTKYRAWRKSGRNNYWNNILNKNNGNYIVKILISNISNREDAVRKEVELQNKLKPKACLVYGDKTNATVSSIVKNKISNTLKGRMLTEGIKSKISNSTSGIKKSKTHAKNIGRSHSKAIVNCRGKIFCSTKEAAQYYNIGRTSIKNALAGVSKTSGKYEDGTRIKWSFYKGERQCH